MNNYYRFTVFLLFTLPSLGSLAQSLENDILLDLSPFFHAAKTVNVQYRLTLPSKSTALRLSGHIQTDVTTDDRTLNASANPGSAYATQTVKTNHTEWDLRLGWQKQVEGDNWFFYYGIDALLAELSTGTDEEDITHANYGMPRVVSNSDITEWQYGVVTFLGIGYRFNKHFSVMVEEGVGFYQSSQTTSNTTKYYFKDNNGNEQLNSTDETSSDQKSSHVSFSPEKFFRLYMAYRF